MEWLQKHVDTVIVLTAILTSVAWINSKFNNLEKEVSIVKTVLLVKGIIPSELAKNTELQEK